MVARQEISRDQLILKLNEVYHDVENQAYASKHSDIFEEEIVRWRRVGTDVLVGPRAPFSILDVGSGTGFVPLQWVEWLQATDQFVCSDLSAGMLQSCKDTLEKNKFPCHLKFLKLDGNTISLPDQSMDVVTLNSVLHHLAKPEDLCRELYRVLKPGGRVVIGHEPTRTFRLRKILIFNYWLLLPIADWKLCAYEIILRLGLYERLRNTLGNFVPELARNNALVKEVNQRLLDSGALSQPLSGAKLSSLLDAQSPTAGGSHADRGFAREDFAKYFPSYTIERYETYKHLNKIDLHSAWLKTYDRWLATRFPENGSSLFICLRKPFPD